MTDSRSRARRVAREKGEPVPRFDRAEQAREIMGRIRYQVFSPEVTTVGACRADGCHQSARGSMTCADCLGYALNDLLGSTAGSDYAEACKAQRWAERAVIRIAEGES